MSALMRQFDLRAINSATKYPSIPTYHEMGERGRLNANCIAIAAGPLFATEKIDGTNSRIVLFPDGGYIIGSREELLHAKGDLIHNPAQQIVEAIRETAERIATTCADASGKIVRVFFGEVYGGNVTKASKSYTACKALGFRLFVVAAFLAGDSSRFVREVESVAL